MKRQVPSTVFSDTARWTTPSQLSDRRRIHFEAPNKRRFAAILVMFGSSLGGQGLAAPPVTQCRATPRLSTGPACTLVPISKPRVAPRQPVATVGGDSLQQRVSCAFTVTASQILSYVRLWRDDGKREEGSTIPPATAELLEESVERVAQVWIERFPPLPPLHRSAFLDAHRFARGGIAPRRFRRVPSRAHPTGFEAGGSSLARRTHQSSVRAQATELDAAVKGARLPLPTSAATSAQPASWRPDTSACSRASARRRTTSAK